jgi:hypothetical protein
MDTKNLQRPLVPIYFHPTTHAFQTSMTNLSSTGPTENCLENLSEASAKVSQPKKRGRPRKIAGKVRPTACGRRKHNPGEIFSKSVTFLQHVCILLTCIFVLVYRTTCKLEVLSRVIGTRWPCLAILH